MCLVYQLSYQWKKLLIWYLVDCHALNSIAFFVLILIQRVKVYPMVLLWITTHPSFFLDFQLILSLRLLFFITPPLTVHHIPCQGTSSESIIVKDHIFQKAFLESLLMLLLDLHQIIVSNYHSHLGMLMPLTPKFSHNPSLLTLSLTHLFFTHLSKLSLFWLNLGGQILDMNIYRYFLQCRRLFVFLKLFW